MHGKLDQVWRENLTVWISKYNLEIPSPGTLQSSLKKASECKERERGKKKKRFKDYETGEESQVGHHDDWGDDSLHNKEVWLRA